MKASAIDQLLQLLKESPAGPVFNPWWQVDCQNDISRGAPRTRGAHLRAYLRQRCRTAHVAMIGEAIGYRGGHFTGIAMTSERILLEGIAGVAPRKILSDITARRTSKPERRARGFSEPTATIIWGSLLALGLRPDEFVLWNAFAWHSFDPCRGLLSNRTPRPSERAAGLPVLKAFLDLFPCERIVALGRIAGAELKELGVDAACVRHPASGGAKLFREQIAQLKIV